MNLTEEQVRKLRLLKQEMGAEGQDHWRGNGMYITAVLEGRKRDLELYWPSDECRNRVKEVLNG